MNLGDLCTLYRREMSDTARPYFWKDEEVREYAADSYRMFVRLTGGIADFTSDATLVDVVAGEAIAELDDSILRIMGASLVSSGEPVQIINLTDLQTAAKDDYGIVRRLMNDKTPGAVRYMVIGRQRHVAQLVQVPEANDQLQLDIYRMPLDTIATDGSNDDFEFDEVGKEHHRHLVMWMRALGYNKHDADTFDPIKAGTFDAKFREYCAQVTAEWERYKHKNRVVSYGGL